MWSSAKRLLTNKAWHLVDRIGVPHTSKNDHMFTSGHYVGKRQVSEILLYNTGKGYLHGLVLGGVLGCMRSLDTHESTHRLTMVRTLDSIAQVAWDGANLTAIGSMFYTVVRMGLRNGNSDYRAAKAGLGGLIAGCVVPYMAPQFRMKLIPAATIAGALALSEYAAATQVPALSSLYTVHLSPYWRTLRSRHDILR